MKNVVNRIEESNNLYVEGLLKTEGRKVCTGMAEVLQAKHDAVYKAFNDAAESIEAARSELQKLASEALAGRPKYLVIDDFTIIKPHANKIEGTDMCYDNSSKHAYNGLRSVSALLTDGNIKIPIAGELFLIEAIGGANRIKKTEIAEALVAATPCDRAIWDAHYSTQSMIQACHQLGISYLGKIPRNRVVVIDAKKGQIQDLFRLTKNQKTLSFQATIGGVPCWINAIKTKQNKAIYLISNDHMKPKSIRELYKIRWKIECFHRTAKQKLGVKESQMRDFKKQELHVLLVMLAYAKAELFRILHKLKHTEAAIRLIRSQNRYSTIEIPQLKAALS